jgi:NAD-dependent dihydropyrimidine dehydrogenase PreA subunit
VLQNPGFYGNLYNTINRERYYMAYKVGDECINCGSCDSECPVDAISEKENARWIDPAKCQDCGSCSPVCPVEAIAAE